jgi:hypothetical protein
MLVLASSSLPPTTTMAATSSHSDDDHTKESVEMDMVRRRTSPPSLNVGGVADGTPLTDEQLRDAALRDDIPMSSDAPEREEVIHTSLIYLWFAILDSTTHHCIGMGLRI